MYVYSNNINNNFNNNINNKINNKINNNTNYYKFKKLIILKIYLIKY